MSSFAPSTSSPVLATSAASAHGLARLWTGSAIVASIAGLKFALHFATANLYGFFIDEIYFLACGQHLAWGYVDMPPLTAFQAWLTRLLFGDSAWSIRLFPSLAGAGLVLLTGAIVRQLGGGRFAQGLAALAVLVAPLNLAVCSYLSMNSIEPLIWMGCAFVVIQILKSGDTKLWIWFGVLAGIGLLNKHTMLVFGFSLVVGLLLTAERRLMFNRWFLIAGAIAFLIFLPNLVWEIGHHFPHLELLANIKRNGRDIGTNPFWFLVWNVILMNPAAAPLWIAGLVSLLSGSLKRFRPLGVATVYNSLPPEERARTAIFGNDFGQSGAIDYYGPRYGLPRSIGGHLSNWYWGPRNYTGQSVLVLGDRRRSLEEKFEDVKAVAEIGHPYAMRQEHFTLFLCHRPRGWTLGSAWPALKNWN